MPFKKNTRSKQLERLVTQDNANAHERQKAIEGVHGKLAIMIFVVITLYAGMIVCGVIGELGHLYNTEESSLMCMATFKKETCDPAALTPACNEILDCIQKQRPIPFSKLFFSVLQLIPREAMTNVPLPAILAGLIVLVRFSL